MPYLRLELLTPGIFESAPYEVVVVRGRDGVPDVYHVQLSPAPLRNIDRSPGGEGRALQPVARQQYLLRKAVHCETPLSTSFRVRALYPVSRASQPLPRYDNPKSQTAPVSYGPVPGFLCDELRPHSRASEPLCNIPTSLCASSWEKNSSPASGTKQTFRSSEPSVLSACCVSCVRLIAWISHCIKRYGEARRGPQRLSGTRFRSAVCLRDPVLLGNR